MNKKKLFGILTFLLLAFVIVVTFVPKLINNSNISWSYSGNEWSNSSEIPECSKPLELLSPIDISKATNVLYPGQTRGTDYKPHGGFRFDNAKNNSIEVHLALDATLWRGSRYIQDGEVQYLLDFISPCGIMLRYDHILTLTEEFKQLFKDFPEPEIDDSRTYNLPNKQYKAGDMLATEIGFRNPLSVFTDFGVYDLRKRNEASQSAIYRQNHGDESEQSFYGICWLNYLKGDAKSIALNLPGSGTEGKVSDYCNFVN